MDLTTTHMGIRLPHPFIAGVPLQWDTMDLARRVEDAGGAAIILPPLFEEALHQEALATHFATETYTNFFAEAQSFLVDHDNFILGPDRYLEHIQKIKQAVQVPVIASLNGISIAGWKDFSSRIEAAGADALELDLYYVATDPDETAEGIEKRGEEIVREVRAAVKLPLCVKLSPFHTALPNFARRLEAAGTDGMVIFHHFYEPDIDIEELDIESQLSPSSSRDFLLRQRWLAILSGTLKCSLAATGGIHTAVDAIKAVMAGASVVQMFTVVLDRGYEYLTDLQRELGDWMERRGYASLEQMKGSMNILHCPNPDVFQRLNYMYVLQTYEGK
jgi:dihydroorotate dehydrogenase (fumarate)